MTSKPNKDKVYNFWNSASCGEDLYLDGISIDDYAKESETRYNLLGEFIYPLANFNRCSGLRILEIGVGLGADHLLFAKYKAELFGIDLTPRSIEHTKRRLSQLNLHSNLKVGDAECLDFRENFFDIVYSWGAIHHSPNVEKCVEEIFRVLKPGGSAKLMIYHKYSITGFMLYFRYAILGLQPWLSLNEIYSKYMESPGTQAFTKQEVKNIFCKFHRLKVSSSLSHADLLSPYAGQRHKGKLLSIARFFWPRKLIKKFFPRAGIFLMIEATK